MRLEFKSGHKPSKKEEETLKKANEFLLENEEVLERACREAFAKEIEKYNKIGVKFNHETQTFTFVEVDENGVIIKENINE